MMKYQIYCHTNHRYFHKVKGGVIFWTNKPEDVAKFDSPAQAQKVIEDHGLLNYEIQPVRLKLSLRK